MSEKKKSGQGASTKQEPAKDVFHVVLYAPNRKVLHDLLLETRLDLGPSRSRPDTEEVVLDVFANEGQIAQLKETGWKLEIRENLSAVGRERQKEVGKGDRFEGGRVVPTGLGKKTAEEE